MIGPRRCLPEPCSRNKVSVVRFLRHHGNIAGWTGIKIPSRRTTFIRSFDAVLLCYCIGCTKTWVTVLRFVYRRNTSTRSPSCYMATSSSSLKNLTVLPPHSHNRSYYQSRRIPASPPLSLQKHTDVRANDFAHSPSIPEPKPGSFVKLIPLYLLSCKWNFIFLPV